MILAFGIISCSYKIIPKASLSLTMFLLTKDSIYWYFKYFPYFEFRHISNRHSAAVLPNEYRVAGGVRVHGPFPHSDAVRLIPGNQVFTYLNFCTDYDGIDFCGHLNLVYNSSESMCFGCLDWSWLFKLHFCEFCPSRILLYFPLSVRPCVHTCDISHLSNISINVIWILREPITPVVNILNQDHPG